MKAKFRRMVEDNKQLASRIDGELQTPHLGGADVSVLRGELADTNRRLEELVVAASAPSAPSSPPASPPSSTAIAASALAAARSSAAPEPAGSSPGLANNITENNSNQQPPEEPPPRARVAPSPPPRLPIPKTEPTGLEAVAGCSSQPNHTPSVAEEGGQDSVRKLREENARLRLEVEDLRRLLGPEAVSLEAELQSAREALGALKADRKRLKAEKFDLLNQMKQLYGTLEDKEKELRDFIRNYEQRMRESEVSVAALSAEREERERERWSLLRHARDEAERSLTLAAQLTARENQLQQMQEQLLEIKRQTGYLTEQECAMTRVNGSGTPGGCMTPTGALLGGLSGPTLGSGLPGDRGSSADSGVRGSSDRESGATSAGGGNLSDSTTDGTPTITVEGSNMDMDSISVVSSIIGPHTYQSVSTPKDSPSLSPLNANQFCRSVEQLGGQQLAEEQSAAVQARRKNQARTGRGGTWGSISRVFARNRHRKMASPSHEDAAAVDPYRSWSPLTEEGYAEKLRLLREASTIPMERWRAPTVLAWLEIALGMPQYGPRCAENVKSGKVLLELSDVELEMGLGISHPMHRKKLRLAIEEHRHPSLVRYPSIAQLGHTWVSSEWLPDLGLAQYSENFATNMVDARMLDHLSKKELEKFLGVTRKFHQASIVHGIHLLRMIKYDRQALAVRRHQCENLDADPLVWTNQRFIRWARNIDLSEYAENLKDSGVHGALVVLEPSFSGDTMATALGIPPSKNIIRRHLTTELEALVLPARYVTLCQQPEEGESLGGVFVLPPSSPKAAFEQYVRVSKAERRRAEKLVGGGSLGRSFSRSCAGGLHGAAEQQQEKDSRESSDKERRRASLRGSLSRALGLRVKQELHRQQLYQHHEAASPESSLASPTTSFMDEQEPPQVSSPSSSGSAHQTHQQRQQQHRRVKSIGDIESVSTVTPV